MPTKTAKPTKSVKAKPVVAKATPTKKSALKPVLTKEKKVAGNDTSGLENAKKALAKEKGAKEKETPKEITAQATGPMAQKWTAFFKKQDTIESKPYNMKASYLEKTAIVHKVLGWGYILTIRNDRLEVLFKDGIKYLISNYK